MRIDQAAALVTGAASGLGRAAAERLHAAGAKVVLVDTNQLSSRMYAEGLESRAGDCTPCAVDSGSRSHRR